MLKIGPKKISLPLRQFSLSQITVQLESSHPVDSSAQVNSLRRQFSKITYKTVQLESSHLVNSSARIKAISSLKYSESQVNQYAVQLESGHPVASSAKVKSQISYSSQVKPPRR